MVIVAENARAGSTLREPVQGSYLTDKETEAQCGDTAGCAGAELGFMMIVLKLGQDFRFGSFSIQGYMKPGSKYGTQVDHQFHLNIW